MKAVVIACNTASAFALETLQREFPIPVIGVVIPGAITAANATRSGRIGIIGTEGTINSGIYTQILTEMNPGLQVYGKACPLFVPLVEEGLLYDSVTVEMAERYLSELQGYDVDTLVLGCTHYPLLRRTIQKITGPDVTLVNPAYETAKQIRKVLMDNGMECSEQMPNHKFFVSDGAEKFKAFANTILPCDVVETKDIDIEKY